MDRISPGASPSQPRPSQGIAETAPARPVPPSPDGIPRSPVPSPVPSRASKRGTGIDALPPTAIEGILHNDPYYVPGLKAGAHARVEQASVFDYIHHRADGTDVGNETGKLMLRRQGADK